MEFFIKALFKEEMRDVILRRAFRKGVANVAVLGVDV